MFMDNSVNAQKENLNLLPLCSNSFKSHPLSWGYRTKSLICPPRPHVTYIYRPLDPMWLLLASLFVNLIYHVVIVQLSRLFDNLTVLPMMKALWVGPVYKQ